MIRRLDIGLALAAMSMLASSVVAAPALRVGTVSGVPGATVNVPLTFTNDSSITGIQFDIVFDAAKITAVGTPTEGTALSSTDHELDSNLVSAGRFRVLVYSNSLAVIPSGQLVVIPFTLSGSVATGTSVALTLSDVEMVEANALVVAGTASHGQINVQASGCDVLGDIAPDGVGNGAVSLADFVLARRKASGTVTQNSRDALCGNVYPGTVVCTPVGGKIRWCADPNSTGNPISLGDAVVLRRVVAQTHEFSCVACAGQSAGITRVAGDLAPRGIGDGRLDIGDVVLALRTSVGLEPITAETTLGDVAPARHAPDATMADGNGIVDIGDVVLLLRAAVGLERLAWPERVLEARMEVATPRVAFTVRVSGWPQFAQVLRVSAPECSGEDSGLDSAGDRWAVTCATDPSVVETSGTLATVTYVGPRVAVGALSVDSAVVGPAMDETSGLLTLSSR